MQVKYYFSKTSSIALFSNSCREMFACLFILRSFILIHIHLYIYLFFQAMSENCKSLQLSAESAHFIQIISQ